MLKPLGDRVVVKVEEKEEQTVGAFVLASNVQETTKIAKVLAVGEGLRAFNGDIVPLTVKAGDQVLVEAHAGLEVKDGEDKVLIIREAEILAIMD